jgi:hypothetical protein
MKISPLMGKDKGTFLSISSIQPKLRMCEAQRVSNALSEKCSFVLYLCPTLEIDLNHGSTFNLSENRLRRPSDLSGESPRGLRCGTKSALIRFPQTNLGRIENA